MSLALGAALAACVLAQPRPAAVDAGPEAARLDRLVVTAQKRKEAAHDVAVALTVVPRDAARAIRHANDVQQAVPGLEIEPAFGTGQPYFRLRGVGFVDYMSNNTAAVSVSLDGVAYALPIQTQGLPFDLERIEVLRGPQGTLYGRNATGGAINLVSAEPLGEADAGVRVEGGERDATAIDAFVTGPVGASSRARLAVAHAGGGAWQRHRDTGQALGARDALGVRARWVADAGPAWQARVDLNLGRDRSDTHGLQLLAPFVPAAGGPAIPADRDRRATGWGLRPEFAARLGLAPDARPGRDHRSESLALTLEGEFDRVAVTSVSAMQRLHRREYADFDATPRAESDQFFDSRVRAASQEVRVRSTGTGAWSWTAGLHAASDRLDEQSHVDLTERLGGELLTEYRQASDTVGLFGQLDVELAPAWRASAGLRRDRERRALSDFATRFVTPPLAFAGPADRALDHDGTSGRLALEWRPRDGLLAWASVARGVKSGGFTAHNTADAATLDPFGAETLVAWEVGAKAELAGNLRLDLAAFHYDYRDQQVLSAYLEPLSQALVGVFVNAPASRIDGVEAELAWQPSPSATLAAFAAYKRGEYTAPFLTYDPVASLEAGRNVFSDVEGESLDFPRSNAGLRLDWARDLPGGRLGAGLSASWRGRYEQTLLLGRGFGIDPYWLAHARVHYTPRGARWSVGAWVRNLFDTDHDLTRNYYLPGTPVVARGAPRSAGLEWAWRY